MDHDQVLKTRATERYLLKELGADELDQFEEHVFTCTECALDLRSAAMFVEQSKAVLAEPQAVPLVQVSRQSRGWLAWLRPAFAVPVMAGLLAVVGYQNLVSIPRSRQMASAPQAFPAWASVSIGSYGDAPVISPAPGESFLLFVRIPPDQKYTSYIADLYDPAGKVEWSLTIPAVEGQDVWPVRIPGANRQPGTYSLAVRGITPAKDSTNIGRASFELQIRQN